MGRNRGGLEFYLYELWKRKLLTNKMQQINELFASVRPLFL